MGTAKIIGGVVFFVFVISGCSKESVPVGTIEEGKSLSRKEEISYQYAFNEGIKKKINGNLKDALTYFKECVRIRPESDAAWYEIGSILAMAGDLKEAIRYYKLAEEADPENIWYKLQIASLYHVIGDRDSSIMMYEKIHLDNPERVDLYYDLAVLHGEYGDAKRALKIYEELEKQYGTSETISIAKEKLYTKMGKMREAEKELLKLIEIDPDESRFYGLLAELYGSQGMNEKAEEIYEQLLEMDPENGLAQLSVIEFYRRKGDYESMFEMTGQLIENNTVEVNRKIQLMITFFTNDRLFNNYMEEIRKNVERLVIMYPEDVRIRTLNADYFVKTENFQQAAEELRFVTRKEKNNYVVWEQLLFVENALEEYEKLYNESLEAIELFPDEPNLYLLRGIASMETGKNKDAIEALNKGLKYLENNKELKVQFYAILGEVYRNDKNHRMSDVSFQKALEIDSENLYVLNNYSYYLSLREEDLENALTMSKICVEKEPDNATYLDTHAWVLFKMKEFGEAREYIERAIKNNFSESTEIIEHYGDILYHFNEKEHALIQWKKAVSMGRESEELLEKIKQAEGKR